MTDLAKHSQFNTLVFHMNRADIIIINIYNKMHFGLNLFYLKANC